MFPCWSIQLHLGNNGSLSPTKGEINMARYTANMPSVGITSFMKLPIQEDFGALETDVGFLGIPYDAGNSWRPGTRFGPREIRNYSARYSA